MTTARYGIDDAPVFVIDQSRCIGCEACVQACMECGTHRGQSLIHLERLERRTTTQTAPMVCMHCEDPTCAQVCPADAIKQTEHGIVQSALKPRCIGCSNCVLACPFGVPKMIAEFDQMMKCDMCTDRTSEGLRPMCASVCPSQALVVRHHRGVRRHPPRVAAARLPVRPPSRCAPRCTPSSTTSTPARSTCSPARRRAGSTTRSASTKRRQVMGDEPATPVPLWRRDFPYEAGAEDEVTRREFTRYLVLGAGAMAAGNVGIAAWTQLRSINTGEPRPIVALADVAIGQTLPVPLPDADDPAVLLRTRRPRARRVQPEVHPPRLCRLLRGRARSLALPVPRRQLRGPHRSM